MEKETNFSHTESLALIESMINKAKDRFHEDGAMYLLWGWVVFACSVGQFILLQIHYDKHWIVWMATWAATFYQAFFLRKKRRRMNVYTYTDDILRYVWITFGILMFLNGFLFGVILGGDYYKMLNPGFLALYGMPTFLSGIILRFRPLIIGGIGCWVLSIGATFTPDQYALLLVSSAMIIAWIIPGYLLRSKYKKSNGR